MAGKNNSSKVLVCLVLALGTAALYWPTLHFDFVNYDDPIYVINNFHIRSFSGQFLAWCMQPGYASMWHPLTWVSHMLDFQLYGIQYPGGHHATSVLLHILNSVLVFAVLHRMTKALWRSALVAALFAWHPMHVESVAWISERKDVLSALFWMLTLWAYLRYVVSTKLSCSPNPTPNLNPLSAVASVSAVALAKAEAKADNPFSSSSFFYLLALVFFALGLMAKPMLVTLPFVLLLLDWWPLERFRHEKGTGVVRLILEKIPFLALSLVACVLTLRAASRVILPMSNFSLAPRMISAVVVYFRYIKKLIWPQDMVVQYPFEYPYPGQEVLLAGLFLMVVSVVAIRLRQKRPFWVTGWFSFLGILVPVIGLVQVGGQPMADRYTYLSSIGIFIIVIWEGWDIANGWPQGRAFATGAAVVALGACLVVSRHQLQYWKNPYALHLHSIDVMPNDVNAHTDYAAFLRDDLRLEEARVECQKALQINTNYAFAHQVLGDVLYLECKTDAAVAELKSALRLDPVRMDTHMDMGQVALARQDGDEAATQYATVLIVDPSNPQARVGLSRALAMQGKLQAAWSQCVEALRLAPQLPEAHHQLAVLLVSQHETAKAVQQYRVALQLRNDLPDTLNNLAWILATDPHAEMRDGVQAVGLALRACAVTQDRQPVCIGTLAAAYAEEGSFDEAVAAAQKAHDVALAQGNQELAARNLQLLEIYRSHHAYHDE